MKKLIPIYGAILLTTMVVVRAVTMEKDEDVSALYQRNTEQQFVENNLTLRTNYSAFEAAPSLLIADFIKEKITTPLYRTSYIKNETGVVEIIAPIITPTIDENLVQDDIVESGLSLDRESTINSNLSLLFSRQRIMPKPIALENHE